MSTKIKTVIPAYHVRDKVRGRGEIEKAVNRMLALVEADIDDAVENELPYATTELDTWFDIPYMNNIDAQRKVYFHIAQALTKSNYTPRVMFIGKTADKQRVFLYTKWSIPQEQQLRDYETNFLRSITLEKAPAPVPELPSVSFGARGRTERGQPNMKFTNFLLKK
jgi:hypothetical protein